MVRYVIGVQGDGGIRYSHTSRKPMIQVERNYCTIFSYIFDGYKFKIGRCVCGYKYSIFCDITPCIPLIANKISDEYTLPISRLCVLPSLRGFLHSHNSRPKRWRRHSPLRNVFALQLTNAVMSLN
jgi:hypothetical protein